MKQLDRNFVFIHVPKAGGTSVTEILFALMDDVYPREKLLNYPLFSDIEPPTKYSLFISHFGYSFYRGSGGYCMSVMRDPVERVLSLFSYWKNPGKGMPPGDPLPEGMTLDEFLSSDRQDIWTNIRNAQTWQIAFGLDVKTRHRFERIQWYELFDIARANIDRMHVVGVIESPEHFLAQLEELFPDKPKMKLERFNPSTDRTLAADIPSETLDRIRSMTELDAKLYAYAASLADRRFIDIIHNRLYSRRKPAEL